MPISYAELSSAISQATQDSFSDRYRPSQRIASINAGIESLTAALDFMMANGKAPEEALRELTHLRIFQTNSQGGINLNDPTIGSPIWGVLGVYARPILVTPGTISSVPDNVSLYRPDLAFSETGSPVERITHEEVALRRNNAMANGNEVLAANPKRVTFAYYIIGDASSTGYQSGSSELRVIPKSQTGRTFIAMSYIKQPTKMVNVNSVTEFPQSMLRPLTELTLSYLTIPQGDGTTAYGTSQQIATQLLGFTANS